MVYKSWWSFKKIRQLEKDIDRLEAEKTMLKRRLDRFMKASTEEIMYNVSMRPKAFSIQAIKSRLSI
jgi:predicted RNase H-like nuclease (RuvC/YqgF family)